MRRRNAATKPVQHIRLTRAIDVGSGTAVIEPVNAKSFTLKVFAEEPAPQANSRNSTLL